MTISTDTENVLNFLNDAAGHGLRKRNDLAVLLELAAEHDAFEEMNALAFNGSHLFNLYTTLRKAAPGSQGYPNLEREFATAVETLRDLLARVLLEAEEEDVERFNSQYYALTQGSLRNLVDLAHDLGVLKAVQNDRKYGSPQEASELPPDGAPNGEPDGPADGPADSGGGADSDL